MKNILKTTIIWILETEARMVLRKYRPRIAAVTGSVGKTSAKDAMYTALAGSARTRKSQKSFNSEIGVPLTILGCPTGWNNPFVWFRNILKGAALVLLPHRYPKWLVLEVGADRPGDIKRIARWLMPDIVAVTAFGKTPVHIEYFDSREDVLAEKLELVKALRETGTLIINADDKDTFEFRKEAHNKPVTFGFSDGVDVQASHYTVQYDKQRRPTGISFKVSQNGSCIPFMFEGVIGVQHVYPVLAGIATGHAAGMNMVSIQKAFSNHVFPSGRMRVIHCSSGCVLIDDTYNSSPLATKSALVALGEIDPVGRRVAILGDMLELGSYTQDEHTAAGVYASQIADVVVGVGARSRALVDAAQSGGAETYHFSDSRKAAEAVTDLVRPEDVVLVKGSQSMRMERVSEALIDDRKQAEELLVRQDEHWKA